jgi:hypothetical protein
MISCGNSSTKEVDISLSPKERIQGVWEVVDASGELSALNKGTMYIFENNLMTTANGIEVTGTFELTENHIKWVLTNMEMNYNYYYDANVLVLEPLNSGQIFRLKKH